MPHAEATFTVSDFTPAAVQPPGAPIATALPVGVATMMKSYSGTIEGRSTTIFTSAFDPASGVGTYVALESFEAPSTATPAALTSSTPPRRRAPTASASTSRSSPRRAPASWRRSPEPARSPSTPTARTA